MARGLGETTCLLSVCGEASNTRKCICALTRASVKPAVPLDAISTSTMARVHIRALAALRRTRLTSPSCPSAWQPNPGRGSTYRRGNSVQRIGTTADLTPAYAFHRLFLQYLQSGWTAERWVLKAPAHLFGLSALLAVYPDAHIIQTHRDPLAVAPSFASFTVAMRRALSSVVEPVAVARDQAQLWARAVDHAIRFRDSKPRSSAQFCDVAYRDLIDDPMGTVRRIYGQFHLPLTETAQSAMRHFLMRDGSRRRTPHAYALEEFGLNRREEERR